MLGESSARHTFIPCLGGVLRCCHPHTRRYKRQGPRRRLRDRALAQLSRPSGGPLPTGSNPFLLVSGTDDPRGKRKLGETSERATAWTCRAGQCYGRAGFTHSTARTAGPCRGERDGAHEGQAAWCRGTHIYVYLPGGACVSYTVWLLVWNRLAGVVPAIWGGPARDRGPIYPVGTNWVILLARRGPRSREGGAPARGAWLCP